MATSAFFKGVKEKDGVDEATLERARTERVKCRRPGANIQIENHSSYDLEYRESGTENGWSEDPIVKAFGETKKIHGAEYNIIPPGSVGFNYWSCHGGGAFKFGGLFGLVDAFLVCGWFSVRVRSPGKNHVICCGFITGEGSTSNKAGIQIRGEDGVLDAKGNISGHGTDPTGAVGDGQALASMHSHVKGSEASADWDTIQEETRAIRVFCKFTNKRHAAHIFKFYDGIPEEEDEDEGITA